MSSGVERIGVLLVNTGEPVSPRPRDVRRYLASVLNDPHVRPFGGPIWWLKLHLGILPSKGKLLAQHCAQVWGNSERSDYVITHHKLSSALSNHFRSNGRDVIVRYAMNHSEPSIELAMSSLDQSGVDRVVVLPLYPQNAYSQAGSVIDAISKAAQARSWKTPYVIAGDYHDDSLYIKAVAASILNAGFDPASDDRLLFSYRSIPYRDIIDGDTYELQVGASSLQIATELDIPRNRWTIAYQTRFGKAKDWANPFTSDVLMRWANTGTGRVFVVCPNYAVECHETRFEIDIELRREYLSEVSRVRSVRSNDFVYVPSLDRTRAHVKVLAHVLEPYLNKELS